MLATSPTKEDLMQQQILTGAKRLFQQYGLAKVTMDDVAKAIGKGRSSLYYYYKSKDEIFDAVVKIEIREMVAAMSRAVDEAENVEQKLHAFFHTKLVVLREKNAFFKMMDVGMDADMLSDFMKTKMVHHKIIIGQESALLKRLLTDGINNGELRQMPEEELEMVIWVLLSSLRGLKREMELESNYEKLVPAVNAFIGMAMHGLK